MTTKQRIKDVKKGEYVQLKDGGPVWVRGDYDRGDKTYELRSFEDVNKFIYKRGEFMVYTGFTF